MIQYPTMTARILVIDDDRLLRSSLKYRLSQEGYDVTTAEDGEEGLLYARRDRPDLVILDIGLPDRDGLDVARTLARSNRISPNTPGIRVCPSERARTNTEAWQPTTPLSRYSFPIPGFIIL